MNTSIEVTKLSSKGQVVLPQELRKKLHLNEGTKFVVLGEGDTVILKKIQMPSLEQAKKLLKLTQAYSKKVGLKRSDVKEAIKYARSQSK